MELRDAVEHTNGIIRFYMSHSDKISPKDRKLFHDAIGPVKPLVQDRSLATRGLPPPSPLQTRLDEEQTLKDMLSHHYDPAELETGEELSFARPGLQHHILRKLRRGRYAIRRQLDLHGMTAATAKEALTVFLREARGSENPCVRIVHGKGRGSPQGQPVLKRKLNHWLRQRKEVLAFCSARPMDGGTGAVYVLLKRS